MGSTARLGVHPEARRGRAAVSNVTNRFESHKCVARDADRVFDDGWGGSDVPPPAIATTVTVDATRTIIADGGFDRSINPYRGCEHGCIYCFARPTRAWLGYSPGLDFETKLVAKPEAPRLLARELARPGYRCRMIALGTNTDP